MVFVLAVYLSAITPVYGGSSPPVDSLRRTSVGWCCTIVYWCPSSHQPTVSNHSTDITSL